MCGIAGKATLCPTGKESAVMEAMLSAMAHRGPDDSGICRLGFPDREKPEVWLGHRRLSIIDTSSLGHQPMFSEDKSICITYNGEIYNYIELRAELTALGYSFASDSDTEVVLAAYAQWGTECFKHFNGMWAMAIFDEQRGKVVLSRDRYGKKPLYYWKSADTLIFASEIKALLKNPEVPTRPNLSKVLRYSCGHYRYVDIDPGSFFEEIVQVPAATSITFDVCLRETVREKYWSLTENMLTGSAWQPHDWVEEFRALFTDAVRLRLRSDVPVGCMLSGGLDSTSITCVAYKILQTPIVAFSGITGDTPGIYDESEYIDAVVQDAGIRHHYLRPASENLFDTVGRMLSFHDEPICTVTWHSLYLIAQKVAQEKVPVVLNGHGGDELFGGYWDHYHYNFADLEQNGRFIEQKHEIGCWQANHGRDPGEIDRYREYIRRHSMGECTELSRFPSYADCLDPSMGWNHPEGLEWDNPMTGKLNKRLYSELLYETTPASLRAEDRNTMAHSIESRSPFLDYRLAEFAFSLPNQYKIRNGLGKWILREAMKGILPESVRARKYKTGFISPADEWFRTVNRESMLELIQSNSLKKRGLWDVAKLQDVFQEHLEGKKNHQMFLWQLLNLEMWFRRFFD